MLTFGGGCLSRLNIVQSIGGCAAVQLSRLDCGLNWRLLIILACSLLGLRLIELHLLLAIGCLKLKEAILAMATYTRAWCDCVFHVHVDLNEILIFSIFGR